MEGEFVAFYIEQRGTRSKGNRERDMAVAGGKVAAVFDCFN